MFTKNCAACGMSFVAEVSKRRFCSRECSWEGNRNDPRITGRPRAAKTVETKCLHCEKTLECTENEIARGRGKYCGQACYHSARSGKSRGPYRWVGQKGRRPIEPEGRECEACGTTFHVGGRGRADRLARFCGMDCQRSARYRHGTKCKELSMEDAAYMAGLIDGEGSVMLVPRHRKVGLVACVSNTNRPVLEWVLGVCGAGAIHTVPRASARHKDGGCWRCSAELAETLLRQVLPHLKIKRAQAEMGVAFQERLRTPSLKRDLSWQLEWMKQMKAMNARGKPDASTYVLTIS